MSAEGDDLLLHIQGFVHGRVPSHLEAIVVELVGRSVVLIMSEPRFYNHLTYVQQLQHENWQLRQALIAQQRPRKAAPKKAAARKTAPVKKAAPAKRPAAKKASSSNMRAFKRGSSGR